MGLIRWGGNKMYVHLCSKNVSVDRSLWGRGADKEKIPPSSQRRARLERRHVNVHRHLRLLAGEAPLAFLSWCYHGVLGPLHTVCVVCLLRFNYGSLRFHHVDKKKRSNQTKYETRVFARRKLVPNVCKDFRNKTLHYEWISQTP